MSEISTERYSDDQIVLFFKFKDNPNFMIQMSRENADRLFDSLANTLGYKDTGKPNFRNQLVQQQSRLMRAENVCQAFERWYFHTNATNWEELKKALRNWTDAVDADTLP